MTGERRLPDITVPPAFLPSEPAGDGSARVGRRSATWALAYLRGRAAAYNRGSVTRANVDGGVQLALRYGASLDDAQQVLAAYRLAWDPERRQVMRVG
jgi:hypothetical protein